MIRLLVKIWAKRVVGLGLSFLPTSFAYRVRSLIERVVYAATPQVDNLPPIFHYWANEYLRPRFEALGFSSPDDFIWKQVVAKMSDASSGPLHVLSVGSGRCELEIGLASRLAATGVERFMISCNDLNGAMLRSAKRSATSRGVDAHFEFVPGDVAMLEPTRCYDIVIANQCLHHFVALAPVLDAIKRCMNDDGIFVVSDVIGRNGHQLWPEALTVFKEHWAQLPSAYKRDRATGRRLDAYVNYNHANVGFEGIRAQDILPLLRERFEFRMFAAFACIILPFIERRFGWNFDPDQEFDRAFIDEVASHDEALIAKGAVKPTQLLACMSKQPVAEPVYMGGLSPAAATRVPDTELEAA